MNDKGDLGSGLTEGNWTFDAKGGLTKLTGTGKNDNSILREGTTVDPGSDGLIAWGRWVDGTSDVDGSNGRGRGDITTLHYVALAGVPTGQVRATFGSFASTAPTTTSGSKLTAVGQINAASGQVTTAILSANLGSVSYNLLVPVAGQTFNLVGSTNNVSGWGFASSSKITSTGNGCSGGCMGSLRAGGISVIGLVGGTAGNRLGVNYGFDSRLGNVSGVIVFKR